MCRASKHQPKGQWIRADKRLAIYLRDEFECVYCGRNLHKAAPQDVTLDHVKAKSKGGENHESNLVTACRSCNCARQDKPVAKFCDQGTRQRIRRQTRRVLTRYRALARDLIAEKK